MMAIVYVVSVPKQKKLGSTNTRYPLRNHASIGAWSYCASPLRLASTMGDCRQMALESYSRSLAMDVDEIESLLKLALECKLKN